MRPLSRRSAVRRRAQVPKRPRLRTRSLLSRVREVVGRAHHRISRFHGGSSFGRRSLYPWLRQLLDLDRHAAGAAVMNASPVWRDPLHSVDHDREAAVSEKCLDFLSETRSTWWGDLGEVRLRCSPSSSRAVPRISVARHRPCRRPRLSRQQSKPGESRSCCAAGCRAGPRTEAQPAQRSMRSFAR